MSLDRYLESLQTVKTATLSVGELFVSNRILYEVIDSGLKDQLKARQWRKNERTEVALAVDSPFAQRLSVIAEGKKIPVFDSRERLRHGGVAWSFVFTIEQNALEAAFLDVALCGPRASLYVRRNGKYPAFEVTNGIMLFREYYFMRTNNSEKTGLADIKHELEHTLIPHRHGPYYWRLLSSWDESPYDLDKTVAYTQDQLDDLLRKLEILANIHEDDQ